MFRKLMGGVVGLAFLGIAGTANSTVIVNGAPLVNPDVALDFTEILLAPNTLLTNQYSSFGIEFVDFIYNGCPGSCVQIPAEPDIGNFSNGNTAIFDTQVTMLFLNNVTDLTFRFAFNGATSISAFLNGSLVESINTFTSTTTHGFTGIVFDEVRFSMPAAMLVDDVAFNFTAVPEPSTLALFGIGLAGLGFMTRRRKRRQPVQAALVLGGGRDV